MVDQRRTNLEKMWSDNFALCDNNKKKECPKCDQRCKVIDGGQQCSGIKEGLTIIVGDYSCFLRNSNMNAKETIQIIDIQISNLKRHRDIDVPSKLIHIEEIPEDNFDAVLAP